MGLNRETQSKLDSIPRLESEIVKQSNLATHFRDKYGELLDVIEAKEARIAELEAACSDLVHKNAELEAENAALKAANDWHYLPETPGTIRDVLGAFAGADALIQCYYHFRTGKWYASEECADFSDADVCNKEMSKAPYAWQELPQMPPRP